MAKPTADDVLGTTTLITGPNELMAERTIDAVRAAVRSADEDADVTELSAVDLGSGALAEITSPSLFASLRCVVVRTLEELPADTVEPVAGYVAAPASDVALVLHHTGGNKGRGVVDRLRKAGAREVRAEAPKSYELPKWVATEVRRHRGRIDEPAAAALVDAVGHDLRALAGAVEQLVADSGDAPITVEIVRRFFGGKAEVRGFDVADAALAGKSNEALEQLRWALSAKVPPVLVTSAIAAGLRALARYQGVPRGLTQGDLAREVGVPPWKLRSLAAQSRAWSQRGLATAIQAAARADADVKGAAGDPFWACERLVISVLRARSIR
jgi:DNA polymerase III subunit delta